MWKIVMTSWGGTHRDFMTHLASAAEAAEICEGLNWVYSDTDGGYLWDLEIEEM